MPDRQIQVMLEHGGRRLRLHVNAQARPSSILEAAARAFGLAGGSEGYGLSRVDGTTLPTAHRLRDLRLRDGDVLLVDIDRNRLS